MAQLLSNLPVGALVKDDETKYYGTPIIWKVMEHNHKGDPNNSTSLITEKIICLKCFDASEPNGGYLLEEEHKEYGSGKYSKSNIKQWLNSETNNWYSAQHSTDAPPNNDNVCDGYNDYDTEPGFLTNFSVNFKKKLLTTTKKTAISEFYGDKTEHEFESQKIFLLSCAEVGIENLYNEDISYLAEGSIYSLFSSIDKPIAYPTTQAINLSEWKDNLINWKLEVDSAWIWVLRTPYAYPYSTYAVNPIGTLSSANAYNGASGIRTACCIPSSTIVSDTPDSNGVYTILWNENMEDNTDKGDNENNSNSSMILWIDENKNIINIYPNEDSTSKIVVEDSLDSTDSTTALSANQGRILNEMIGDIGVILDNINRKVI